MLDPMMAIFIKNSKEELKKGTVTLDEYTKGLAKIFEKMREFNGMTSEEFYAEVNKL
ncbi:hypothetical protein ACFSCX_06410 [Bacillus salitolerans]|uniref:Uncharacterized protein n=1 Tax=Bacillus salitolerans TaxID=1437434 RepID=A0ABW4LQ15_9BACI